MNYRQVEAGEWVQPIRRGYKLVCCDCDLVHTVNFRLAKKSNGACFIQFQAFRDEPATVAARKKRKK